MLRVPPLAARLIGSYERELHPAVEALVAREPELVVNIGAADGYYAVGMARRCKRAHVLAFELDRFQARTCSALARVNGVSDRVHASGLCTVPRLAEINSAARMTVICDCEGAEFSLLDPEQVGWLREASLIVEVHEGTEAGTVDVLRGRLEQTHDIATVRTEPRYPSEYPALNATPGLTDLDKALLLVEPRGSPMTWLTADPR